MSIEQIQLSRAVATMPLTVTIGRARKDAVSLVYYSKGTRSRAEAYGTENRGSRSTSWWLGSLERRIAESGCEIPVLRDIAAPAGVPTACCEVTSTQGFVMSGLLPFGEKKLLTKKEVAYHLGICPRTVEREIARNRFPRPMRIRGKRLFDKGEIDSYVARLKSERDDPAGGVP